MVELYDLDADSDSTLANISTRAWSDRQQVMIGGVIFGNGAATRE
jgi:hypothetical protein